MSLIRNIRHVVVLIILFNIFTFAQEKQFPKELNTLISVDFIDTKFSEILKAIGKKSKVNVNYSKEKIPYNQLITLKETDKTVISILKKLAELTNTEIIISNQGDVIISKKSNHSIKGKVIDRKNNFPLIGANIIIKDSFIGTTSNINGNFSIDNLKEGIYTISFKYIGYKEKVLTDVVINDKNNPVLEVKMASESISLSEIVITPGSFGVMQKKPSAMQTLSKEDIQNMSLGEDVYRAITRIPGISSGDFSSKFTIRGGETDEILVTLDGMELIEPFHMKDIDGGVFSIVDAALIGEADVLSGAFPVEYGDKMSGVLNIKSLKPIDINNRLSASISMMNARLMYQGVFNNNKGAYVFSARRGYLDYILSLTQKDHPPKPIYFDIYGKVDYQFSPSDRISVNFLYGGDSFSLDEDDSDITESDYSNASFWITSNKVWNKKVNSQSVVFFNKYSQLREGIGYDNDDSLNFLVNDDRKFNHWGIRHSTYYDFSDNILFKFGLVYTRTNADYNYQAKYNQSGWNNRAVEMAPSGSKFSAFLSTKLKISPTLFGELGVRYDKTSYTGDDTFSPRINLAWNITSNTFLRAGYGYFYQSQNIHDIRVENGETVYHKAELAKHHIIGIEHFFAENIFFRLEGYYKKMEKLKPAYRNIVNSVEMFPEVQYDILNINLKDANSRGIELFAKYDTKGFLGLWGCYAFAFAEENIDQAYDINGNKVIENLSVSRPYDQRQTIKFDLNFRFGNNWFLNLAWQYRTGWAYTEKRLGYESDGQGEDVVYFTYFDEYQSSRYPDYHRLDLKLSKYYYTNFGTLNIFIEVMNLYNRNNVRYYSYKIREGNNGSYLKKKANEWLPLVPSIGIRWDLDF